MSSSVSMSSEHGMRIAMLFACRMRHVLETDARERRAVLFDFTFRDQRSIPPTPLHPQLLSHRLATLVQSVNRQGPRLNALL